MTIVTMCVNINAQENVLGEWGKNIKRSKTKKTGKGKRGAI